LGLAYATGSNIGQESNKNSLDFDLSYSNHNYQSLNPPQRPSLNYH